MSNTDIVIDAEIIEANTTTKVIVANTDTQNDYAFSRQNLYDLMTKGSEALNQLADIASASQHPRSYEVLATLIKNLGDVNDKFMNLHRDMRDLEGEDPEPPPQRGGITVEKAVFVGTTADLLDMAKLPKP